MTKGSRGGNAHNRAKSNVVHPPQLPDIPLPLPSVSVFERIFRTFENAFVQTPISVVGGIVGIFVYGPILTLCSVSVLVGVHRSKSLEGLTRKTKIVSWILIFPLCIGLFFEIGRVIDKHRDHIPTITDITNAVKGVIPVPVSQLITNVYQQPVGQPQQEAFMDVTGLKIDKRIPNQPYIEANVGNRGRPGIIDRVYLRAAVVDAEEDSPILPSYALEDKMFSQGLKMSHPMIYSPPMTIGMNEGYPINSPIIGYTSKDDNALLNFGRWLFVTGRVDYEDKSGPHYTEFCRYLIPANDIRFLRAPTTLNPMQPWTNFYQCGTHNIQK
jgi:hypothetical protein